MILWIQISNHKALGLFNGGGTTTVYSRTSDIETGSKTMGAGAVISKGSLEANWSKQGLETGSVYSLWAMRSQSRSVSALWSREGSSFESCLEERITYITCPVQLIFPNITHTSRNTRFLHSFFNVWGRVSVYLRLVSPSLSILMPELVMFQDYKCELHTWQCGLILDQEVSGGCS